VDEPNAPRRPIPVSPFACGSVALYPVVTA
jgi:hypothetical protein